MKKLALILIIAIAIVLAAIYFKPPSEPTNTANLTISDFSFAESSTTVSKFKTSIENNKIVFEGPIAKPTPCNGLAADYDVAGNTITITITTTPFEGFCAQAIAETFYRGSFSIAEMPEKIKIKIIYGGSAIGEAEIIMK